MFWTAWRRTHRTAAPASLSRSFDLNGEGYARDWALPQFYFHIMAAYAILRHQGIALGKADYSAHMFAYLRRGAAVG